MTAEATKSGERQRQPALVMLHGFALDSRMWRPQVEEFAADHRVITLDLPGFGAQARQVGEVDPCDGVLRALNVAKVERAHLLANSFGAAVAADFALRYRDRVASLIFVGPLLLGRRTGIESWSRCVSLAREGDRTTASEIWLDDPLFETLRHDDDLFEELRQMVLDYGGGHWTGKVSSTWGDPDPVTSLSKLDVPSLIVSGERDIPSFLIMAEAYAKTLPRARREVLKRAGHLANLEQPAEFNTLLREFLKST
jgi:pimeloyl-ACP methyl ester carboxylesterase